MSLPQHSSRTKIAFIARLEELAPRYDVIISDVWGVLHNGLTAYEAAGAALMRFRERGGRVVLVSNAPRPGLSVAAQLDQLGVPRAAWDGIVTSGDLTRSAVIERAHQTVHHLGPPRDLPIFGGLDIRFGEIEAADYVVCTGFDDDDTETVDQYRERLERMRSRNLLMICANPDLVVERGDRLVPCAGALAQAYEEMGGEVFYAGKPHRPVYEAALSIAAKINAGEATPLSRVLAIGDAIRTDIAGANAFGIDSLLVARGIHTADLRLDEVPLMSSHAQDWLDRQAFKPNAITDVLT